MSLIDHYKVITVTHHNLDIADIGNFYVKPTDASDSTDDVLHRVKSSFGIDEMIYLETCNRVCYILFADFNITDQFLGQFFSALNSDLEKDTIDHIHSFVDFYEGESALKHVFEMASSMDSLVIGEREIFRQFRKAYDSCKASGLCSDNLRILEKLTVSTAKRIYSETKIAEKALSVVSLAIQAMKQINDSKDQRILLIGSGETNTLVGKFLRKYEIKNVSIYNRSIDNAKSLADMMQARSYHLSELSQIDGEFDTIFICTSANQVVVDSMLYRKMIKNDDSKKLIIDLAVPRNISEEVVDTFNVEYIDISKLKSLSEKNLATRKKELHKAQPIIAEQLRAFKDVFQQRQLEKALSDIPVEIKQIKHRALNEVYKDRLSQLDEVSLGLVHEMLNYMEKKCISVPIKKAREQMT